ncbi:MAG: hypothetical protein V1696_04010 [Candidatus Jorgensenbacteria bacterium]
MNNNGELKKKLDELVKNADFILASPDTLEKLKARGFPIQSKFVTYQEYLDKLFEEKKKNANEIIQDFPPLSDKLANAAIKSLYEEIRECYALGLFGAAITLSVILLELGFKYKIYNKRREHDPKSQWEKIEIIDLTTAIKNLKNLGELSNSEKKELDNFNLEIRNPYIHYNLQKLVCNIMVEKLPLLKTETGEMEILENVEVAKKPYLWFSGKKFVDKNQAHSILKFCIGWVNKVLG